ncbi:hypothetical protein V1264_004813 [Littorina saxatilis]|uniref:F-box domain-containing protein n=2 Tax=Littorina saxatilis TaxID=31220 RepID=A0AAN9G7K5_9CAEN
MTQSCVLSEPCSLYGIESLPFELTQSEIILKPSSTDDHLLKVSSVPSDIFLGASSRTLTTDLFGQVESDFSLEQGSLKDIESLPASEINLASSLQTIRASSRETSPRLASNGGHQTWSTSSLEAESRKDKESLLSSDAPCQGLSVMGTDPEHADSVDSEALSQAHGHSDGGVELKHLDSVTPTVCSVSMEDVPDEVFLNIFSFLAQEDLCRHVTRVCKRWHRLAYDSTLWRKLDCSRWRSTGYQLQQIVLRIPGAIRWLDISAMDNLTLDDVAAVSVNCPELTYLDVGFVDDFNSDMLYLILMNCPKLCFLNVEGCRNANNEMMLTLAKTSGCQLRQLNFSHCSLTDESLTLLMKHMTGITHLNIDGISWISDEVVRQLASTYQDTLESLELDGNDLSDSTMEAVCGCQRLHTLSVSFCDDLSDRSVRHLLRLKQLEKLVLRKGLGLSAFAVTECFTSSVMQNLAYLDLTECQQLNDQGVQAIAQCCGRSVKTLNLAWCWLVTDRGVEAVAQHCWKMEKLYLTGLHRLEGAWLPVAVRNMKHLTYITFEQCNEVVDPVIEEAVREKHDLVILNYYGEVFIHRCQQ